MKSGIPNSDLSTENKAEFIADIPTLDETGMELIATLIRAHQIETTSKRVDTSLPYKAMSNGDDMLFDLEALPNPLKQILYKFVKIHIDSMKENMAFVISRTP